MPCHICERLDTIRAGLHDFQTCDECGNRTCLDCLDTDDPDFKVCMACFDPVLCRETFPRWWAEQLADQADVIRKSRLEDGYP